MIKTKYLIIGNAAAAVGGIDGIRSVDPEGNILVVTEENHESYSRPLISYWLEGVVDRDHMAYRTPDYYENNRVTVMTGSRVKEIMPDKWMVTLETGENISYEKLLVATGSVPFVPPIKGRDTAKNTFTFTTLDDAVGIAELLDGDARVVILGAGLIGLKAAEAVVEQCASVTVIDLADRVMPSVLDKEASLIIEGFLKKKGIALELETSIDTIGDMEVKLSSNKVLPYDILILAVGTRPALQLVEEAGGEVGKGIITDSNQLTTLPDVYAAGDCTQSYDISSNTDKNLALLPNAYLQGEVAGKNMAGSEAEYTKAFPVNAMGLLGLYMMTAGSYIGESKVVTTEESFKKFFIEDNRLKGFIIIGDCGRSGIYTDLIRENTDLSELDTDRLFEEPQLMVFPREERYAKVSVSH